MARRPMIEGNADGRPRVWMNRRTDGRIDWAMHPVANRRVASSMDAAMLEALDGDLSTPAVVIWEAPRA